MELFLACSKSIPRPSEDIGSLLNRWIVGGLDRICPSISCISAPVFHVSFSCLPLLLVPTPPSHARASFSCFAFSCSPRLLSAWFQATDIIYATTPSCSFSTREPYWVRLQHRLSRADTASCTRPNRNETASRLLPILSTSDYSCFFVAGFWYYKLEPDNEELWKGSEKSYVIPPVHRSGSRHGIPSTRVEAAKRDLCPVLPEIIMAQMPGGVPVGTFYVPRTCTPIQSILGMPRKWIDDWRVTIVSYLMDSARRNSKAITPRSSSIHPGHCGRHIKTALKAHRHEFDSITAHCQKQLSGFRSIYHIPLIFLPISRDGARNPLWRCLRRVCIYLIQSALVATLVFLSFSLGVFLGP
ncbi:uncharacterized protein BDR25DRAFT_360309 [Lindgomyces ingoldianus]|uniref:Uncharacterized protein n=1 Tax=Lindgomyces ingoldianus TaxID=673940 RepID=A0ACB6QFS8_9PLEO|nr:uncharacterized protein BDR25DRAFT_360309 [Lindgomyces ingoldianus]KAF2465781.1 hypothetical protein BDR25DRAFT_360309 [Lindgomyces ingoldianus]